MLDENLFRNSRKGTLKLSRADVSFLVFHCFQRERSTAEGNWIINGRASDGRLSRSSWNAFQGESRGLVILGQSPSQNAAAP